MVKQEALGPEPPSSATQPQSNAAMLVHDSPKPQDPVIGGFQPQDPVAIGGIQPQSPVVMPPQSPVMMQPQYPVVMQPQAVAPMQVYPDHGAISHNRPLGPDGKRDWTYGLMDCFGRFGLCCWAVWCPCVVYSKTKQRVHSLQYEGRPLPGGGTTYNDHCFIYSALVFVGHPWLVHVQRRVEMRERYAIRGHAIKDFLASVCCNPCALTQERREVEMEEASFQAAPPTLIVEK